MDRKNLMYICPYCRKDVPNLEDHYRIGCFVREAALRKKEPSLIEEKIRSFKGINLPIEK